MTSEELENNTKSILFSLTKQVLTTTYRPPSIGLDGMILRLDEELHGVKQAPLTWFENLCKALAGIDSIFLPFDTCVFISSDHKIIVVVYLADITTAVSRSDINRLIDYPRSRFKVTVKGRLKYILGIEIIHTSGGIELS